MQIDAELVCSGIAVQFGIAHSACLSGHALSLPLLVCLDHLIVVGNRVGDFFLAHTRQPRHDVLVVFRLGVATAERWPEDTLVGVDGVIGDGMAEELQVDTQLVGTAGDGEAADDGIATQFFPGLAFGATVALRNVVSLAVVLWRVVGEPFENSHSLLAICTHAVEAELGADLEDGLLADDFALGKFAHNSCDVLLLDGPGADLGAHVFGGLAVLANEHDAAGEPVEPIAGQRVPAVSAVGSHDLNNGVEVVAAGRMDWHARGLVDDDEVVVFVDDADGRGRTRGLMAVERV